MTQPQTQAPSPTGTPRTVHVEHCMGTVFTIDIRDPGDWSEAIREVVDRLHHVDRVFSTYRPDSDISRMRRGELTAEAADPAVRTVLALCARAEAATNGYFTTGSGPRLDPTGLVKGWAIEEASLLLRERGSANHAVNGGGDMQLSGGAAPDRTWTVGISDPHVRTGLVGVVTGRDFSVATSGVAERGLHITNPRTGRPATQLASASITGPSLTCADAYATAAFAMGHASLDWIETTEYHSLLVTDDRRITTSSGWPKQEIRVCS